MKCKTSDEFIKIVSEKKTEAVNAYLIKNSKGEGGGGNNPPQKNNNNNKQKQTKNGGMGWVGRQ